jgi:hypothetical protein
MRIIVAFVIAGILFPASPLQAQISEENELRRIETEIARLEQQNDPALAKFLADDWVCVGTRGLSKKEFIEKVKFLKYSETHVFKLYPQQEGSSPYIEKKNLTVHVFWDTAVVTYIKKYRQSLDVTKFFDEDDTDIFTRDASGWHLRLTKISPVQAQTASN